MHVLTLSELAISMIHRKLKRAICFQYLPGAHDNRKASQTEQQQPIIVRLLYRGGNNTVFSIGN